MSVSLCILRIEIDEDIPEMADKPEEIEAAKEQKKKDRGARESSTITVETYASKLADPKVDPGILPTSSRKPSPEDSADEDTITFFCGNPLIEVTRGLLHVYKEGELKDAKDARSLCLLNIPGALGAKDLLAFTAACQKDITYVRILRDGSPDHYMAVVTFSSSGAAAEFAREFAGTPYSCLEPGAVCGVAWVSRIEWGPDGRAPPATSELPACAVCLERLDDAGAVLAVQCGHAFHVACLCAWRVPRCPVCRAATVPDPPATQQCAACREEEEEGGAKAPNSGLLNDTESGVPEGLHDEMDSPSLWICLICAHVGCGRYVCGVQGERTQGQLKRKRYEKGHAAEHFVASNHTFALQIGSNRVWDYAADSFVHRLVQNKADGKPVALHDDKHDELVAQLAGQLDLQREHYQGHIQRLEKEHSEEVSRLSAERAASESHAATLHTQLDTLLRDKHNLHKKLATLTEKLATVQNDLADEKRLSSALASSQAEWQAQAQQREQHFLTEIGSLKEQLRDVMFFVEGRSQLQRAAGVTQDELASAAVTVAPTPPTKPHRKRRS